MVGDVRGGGLSLRWSAASATAVGTPKKKKERKGKKGSVINFLKNKTKPNRAM